MTEADLMYTDKDEFVEKQSVFFDGGDFSYQFDNFVDKMDSKGLQITYRESDEKDTEISIYNAYVLTNLRDFINKLLETYADE